MKNSKKILLVLGGAVLALTACGGKGKKDPTPTPSGSGDPTPTPTPTVTPTPTPSPTVGPELATGLFDYTNRSNAERTEILGALEKWAVDKKLTGITVYEDGGYVMYNPIVQKGTNNYIKGYGFGILSEGKLTDDLSGEEQAKYKRYYHTFEQDGPAKILYMDDDGSVVGDLVGYVAGGLYETIMNETRTGYTWVGDLARNDAPIAVDPAADGSSRVYQIPVKTGADLKYNTLSSNSKLSAFNGREVALDDYLTPYQVYYTKAFGILRTAEVKDNVAGSLLGAEATVAGSENGYSDENFQQLGIKAKHSAELGDYLEFTLNAPVTPFWARYYLSSNMFAPVPKDFLAALGDGSDWKSGVSLWGKYNSSATLSPRDTFLSTGPYTIEEWNKDQLLSFKRNPFYVYGEDRATTRASHYYIEGVYVDIINALKEDNEAAFKKFLANQLHACGIPSTQLEEYARDPRTTIVPGATTTKLNLNTCTSESWEALFGEQGSITQTPKSNYWKLKPAMANSSFVDGLSFALDRLSLAIKLGRTPSNNYFGSGYYSDPEEGIFYNDTEAHAAAVAASLEGTDGYGFSVEKAKAAFKKAAQELIAQGAYKVGDTIELEMAWQAQNNIERLGQPIAKNFEDAFNAAETGLTLKVNHYYPDVWSDVYYKKMMVGQFDIGFGGIEGNAYNPLNFLEVLKSDNSSQFTLNWGIPTNEYAEIEWDGKLWTFDALWEAADHGAYVRNGKCSKTFDFVISDVIVDADGQITIRAKEFVLNFVDGDSILLRTETVAVVLYAFTDPDYADYTEVGFYPDNSSDMGPDTCEWTVGNEFDEDGYRDVEIVIPADVMAVWYGLFPQDESILGQGFDVYRLTTMYDVAGKASFFGTAWEGLFLPANAE